LEAAQPVGREVGGFHIGAGLPQGPQRHHAIAALRPGPAPGCSPRSGRP
jgi:hypothetical protein